MKPELKNDFNTEFGVAIGELPFFLKSIEKNIDLCIESFNTQNDEDAYLYLNKSMNCISSFIKLTSILCRETKNINTSYNSRLMKDLQIHLLSLIKGIQFAIKNADIIMLNDLLEYELKDNLSQWRISIIPSLRTIFKI